ncbi:MAG: DedA family protein [Alteromonadaceae bacterium]|jgi:uncharacterized membrane protein YdjX (TVP38/TMEM64 family)|uniref:TVP38/TMEM64 family membrane protein n=1 Tax=Paraglaciecola agarilytica NO2 TaxID=1125747 RepID=A0ABQ0I8J3_9ALTE|nr:VTT domain-containing protein [Paraglaciecola agarilytica]MBN28191.1 DedA family protein [Alteromonadaceae bacterium]GAC05694.1 hypothetical protein GAGA_2855 [Paraglaciecola agarilytica NO2]|tara:strand:+ start:11773 stop:12504 length:732 start_codon:yes stop_codon:yes gene_type:complete
MTESSNYTWYKHGLGTLGICVVIGLVLSNFNIFSSLNENWIDRDIRDSGGIGLIYFVGLGAITTACGAPRQIVAFLGGYAFGAIGGTLFSTIAVTIGCSVTFYISKYLVKPFVQRKFAHQSKIADSFLSIAPTRKTIIIRMLPLGSNVLTNIVAGSTNVSPKAFITGSMLGYLPQMLIFALLGKGLLVGSEWKIILSAVLFLLSSLLSYSLYKKYHFNLGKRRCAEEKFNKLTTATKGSNLHK